MTTEKTSKEFELVIPKSDKAVAMLLSSSGDAGDAIKILHMGSEEEAPEKLTQAMVALSAASQLVAEHLVTCEGGDEVEYRAFVADELSGIFCGLLGLNSNILLRDNAKSFKEDKEQYDAATEAIREFSEELVAKVTPTKH